jgi:hypothetical protein
MYQGNPDLGVSEFADVLALVTSSCRRGAPGSRGSADDRCPTPFRPGRPAGLGYAIRSAGEVWARPGGTPSGVVLGTRPGLPLAWHHQRTPPGPRASAPASSATTGSRLASGEVVASFALPSPARFEPDAIRTTAGERRRLGAGGHQAVHHQRAAGGLFVCCTRARGSSGSDRRFWCRARRRGSGRAAGRDHGPGGSHTAEVSFVGEPDRSARRSRRIGRLPRGDDLAGPRPDPVAALAVGARRYDVDRAAPAGAAMPRRPLRRRHGGRGDGAAAISRDGGGLPDAPSAASCSAREMAGRVADLAVQVQRHGMRGTVNSASACG